MGEEGRGGERGRREGGAKPFFPLPHPSGPRPCGPPLGLHPSGRHPLRAATLCGPGPWTPPPPSQPPSPDPSPEPALLRTSLTRIDQNSSSCGIVSGVQGRISHKVWAFLGAKTCALEFGLEPHEIWGLYPSGPPPFAPTLRAPPFKPHPSEPHPCVECVGSKLLGARSEVRLTRAFGLGTVRRRWCKRECGLEVAVREQQGWRIKHENREGEMEKYDMRTANTLSHACTGCLYVTQ